MKILVCKWSSSAEVIVTTPTIRLLKSNYPEASIHFITDPKEVQLLQANPYLDKIHGISISKPWKMLKTLKMENFDWVVDLEGRAKSMMLLRRVGKKYLGASNRSFKKWLKVNFKLDVLPKIPLAQQYLNAAKPLGTKEDYLGLDYFIPDADEVPLDWLPTDFRQYFYVVAIGAKSATRKLPLKRLIELCDRINKPILLVGGAEDVEIGEAIASFFEQTKQSQAYEEGLQTGLNKRAIIFNACGKFNFNQTASLVRQSSGVFTMDTVWLQIAAAFQKRIFAILGSSSTDFGVYPYQTKFSIFENYKLACRPCSVEGKSKCPLGHFKCMNDVVFDFYLP